MNWSFGAPSKPPDNAEMSLRSSAGLSPAWRLSVNHFTAALLACWVSYGQAAETWPLVVTADQSGQCTQALSKGTATVAHSGFGDLVLNAQLEFRESTASRL